MDWTKRIAGCFGDQDQIFAGHYNDEERAFALLSYLRKKRIGWAAVRSAFLKHLKAHAKWKPHRKKQMKKVRKFYKPWLDD